MVRAIGASTAVCGLPGVRSLQFDEARWLTINRVWELPDAGADSDDSLNFNTSRARNRRRVADTYLNGRGERIRADTPSPSLLIPVANLPSYVRRVGKTA